MDATNQALEGIKGQNVGNVDGGLSGGQRRDVRVRGGESDRQAIGPVLCHSPEGVTTLVSASLRGNPPPHHYRGMSIHAGHGHYP